MPREVHGAAVGRDVLTPRVIAPLRPEPISGISAWAGRMANTRAWRGRWVNIVAGEQSCADESSAASDPNATRVSWSADASPAEQTRRVAAVVRERAPCVIVGNDVAHAYLAGALLRHRGVRTLGVAHTSHEADEDFFERCAPLADHWVAVSRGAAARFGRWLANEQRMMTILPCGVDVAAMATREVTPTRTSSASPPLRLLYAGRLDKHCKRVLDLVLLADALLTHDVSFTLTIAGDGSAREELHTAMSRHIADGRVEMLGRVAPDAMSRLYASHDVLVLTSAFEGSPVTAAEAMAHGCAVAITTGCGGAVDVVTDGAEGVVVPVGEMDEMARRIARLARDPAALSRMRSAARSLARRIFDIERHANEYAKLATACEMASAGYAADDAVALDETWSRVRSVMALLGACEASEMRTLARWWLADVGANVNLAEALPMETPRVVRYAERKLIDAITRLGTAGHSRLALFGAGRHTQRLVDVIAARAEIVAILDDGAGEAKGPPAMIGGKSVVKPAMGVVLGVQAVIVSSDEHEEALANRAREALPELPLTTLYGPVRAGLVRPGVAA